MGKGKVLQSVVGDIRLPLFMLSLKEICPLKGWDLEDLKKDLGLLLVEMKPPPYLKGTDREDNVTYAQILSRCLCHLLPRGVSLLVTPGAVLNT